MGNRTFFFKTEFVTTKGEKHSGFIFFDEDETRIVNSPAEASKKTFSTSGAGAEYAKGLGMFCATLIDCIHGSFDVPEESFFVEPVLAELDDTPRTVQHGAKTMNEYKDRFGKIIKEGDIVAMAITMNNRRHMHSFITCTVTKQEKELVLEGAFSFGDVSAQNPNEMIILDGSTSVREANHIFYREYGREHKWDKTLITGEEAHSFYEKVQEMLGQVGEFDNREKLLNMIKALVTDEEKLKKAEKAFEAIQAAEDIRKIAEAATFALRGV